MPTYEYECTEATCAHTWEQDQSIKENPLKTCPKCAKDTAVRIISKGTGFILQGGGWYRDGYS